MKRLITIVAVALAACSTPAQVCTQPTQTTCPAPTVCPPQVACDSCCTPTVCPPPPAQLPTAGTRLTPVASKWTGTDGSVYQAPEFTDSGLGGTNCVPLQRWDGKTYCMPATVLNNGIWFDSTCTMPAALFASSQASLSQYASVPMQGQYVGTYWATYNFQASYATANGNHYHFEFVSGACTQVNNTAGYLTYTPDMELVPTSMVQFK